MMSTSSIAVFESTAKDYASEYGGSHTHWEAMGLTRSLVAYAKILADLRKGMPIQVIPHN